MSRIITLASVLGIERNVAYNSLDQYVALALKLKKHHGQAHASKLLKELYNSVKMYSLGCKIQGNTSLWSKTSKRGLPSKIERLIKPLDLSNDDHARWLLSLFSLYETWKSSRVVADIPSLEEIQSSDMSPTAKLEFRSSAKIIVNNLRRCGMIKEVKSSYLKDYLSLKGGPFGPATLTAHHDAKALLANRQILEKISRLQSSITSTDPVKRVLLEKEVTGTSRFSEKECEVYPILKTIAIPDKGPKVRTITVGNYYLQRTLLPIHNGLMETLRSIPEDGTYKQSSAAHSIAQWTAQGYQPWCFDLTAATDRFPIQIQYLVLKEMYPELASRWYAIMRKAESYSPDQQRYFKFQVGQPMGLYSSWAAFSITHHIVIRYAFMKANLDFRNRYCIIGDDVAILDKEAALRYRELILSLGISISPSKSITPEFKRCDSKPSGELAKRYFRDGVDITPLRPYELDSFSGKGWPLFTEFIPKLIDRWGEEKLTNVGFFDPASVEGSFVKWVDKTHRKKLLLVLSTPPVPPYLKGLEPGWWPLDIMGQRLIEAASFDVLRNKHSKICRDLHDIRSKQDLLQCTDNTITSKSWPIDHPLTNALRILDSDLLKILSNETMGNYDFKAIYQLGINIDLLKSIVIDNKTVKDYQSFQLKRATAMASFRLDVWRRMITQYRFKPVESGYPK